LKIQQYTKDDLPKLVSFCKNYLETYPDAKLYAPEFYTYHPALQDSKNVLCVFDSAQRMVGFAPLSPVLADNEDGPHDIWAVILAEPNLEISEIVREFLFTGVVERANELKASHSLPRIRLAADMMASQVADIDFLKLKGFEVFDRVVVMSRDTMAEIPPISVPDGVTFRQQKLASEEEQVAYLQVYNRCFPSSPKTLEGLRFLLESPIWEMGVAIAAYAPLNEYIGSILIYLDEDGFGITDDVMVLPQWRGQNIAKGLIREGLNYFQGNGVSEVRLEVLVNNVPAVSVYESMGFCSVNEQVLLGKYV
jgi:ribosomal protein S18 acetylase RimI-like enzyme